ncbi:flavin reductase (DIM6/NTAB) family NADH-FMN oxidoreductase RutF [Salsuginibacillus halophilus]|uniref:Flavin reductase (DIM6/NTAB) family NADH-FMN oxidoreductase RutF n=1 Tax=Salsuginibacillus halophilus TaxID=517424 RepID=A0A2P8HQI7_9BACI|nr:flavin reductase family protein [Salsuginibacillus halophilus]PSL48475.1 flavin reductase (DIM6/NTAB) family NADH-FMN oxidoreductase RutF [Salsuginibacillus halophilus]
MEDRLFRTAMGKFATGVTVITTEVDGEVYGMTANAFMSVSMDPKLVLISVANKAKMLSWVQESGEYCVNILSQDQQEVSMQFAGQLREGIEVNFEDFEGQPAIADSIVTIPCKVYQTHEAGDHTLFVGEVQNIKLEDGEPLLYFEGGYKEFKA